MSTINIELSPGIWKKISEVACSFQVITNEQILVTEQSSIPTDGSVGPHKVARSKTIYDFVPSSGYLWGLSSTPAVVGVD
jgi:hypothetical protein